MGTPWLPWLDAVSRGLGGASSLALRIGLGLLVLGSGLAGGPAQAATFVVNSTGDAADAVLGNGVCATAGAVCTLRAAIEEANALGGADVINFNIAPVGPKTISPSLAYPTITTVVTIDGTTQPGYAGTPIIELNAASAGANTLTLSGAGSSGSTIRGLVINRSPGCAIRLFGTSNNVIAGNFLGTNMAGTAALANNTGIYMGGSATATDNNRIGGTLVADRNVISGNTFDGVQINGGAGGAANNLVQGNYVGVDVTGTVALGNGGQGVAVFTSFTNTNNVVGGTALNAGNVISGNGNDGVLIANPGTTGTLVQGNFIGTNAAGTAAIPNVRGVEIQASAGGNTIGGTAAGAANRIAHNLSGGVELAAPAGTGNQIIANGIYSNGTLGIDLGENGVTANDALDADTGPNDLLNFPSITSAFGSAGTVTVDFTLDVPAGSYRIEFFKNPSGADPTGFGEGQAFASSRNVTHPGGGALSFSHSFAGNNGDVITATSTACTDGAACTTFGSTSEFSNAVTAPTPADLAITKVDDLDPAGLGGVLTYTLAVTNGGPSGATGVTLTDGLPVGMAFESATPTQGSCGYDGPTRTLTCALGSIAPSSSASVSLKVRPQAVGTFVNTASVLGNEPDPAGGNNTATQTTTVEISSIGVRFFTVTSTSETNVLEWVNPDIAEFASTEIRYRTDGYPKDALDGTFFYNAGVRGGQEKQTHFTGLGSNGVTYYYGAFVHRTALPDSLGRFVTGRPFDTITGPVKWSFSTGATAVAPPTVGGAGVVAPSNDRVLYAMERGPLSPGGEWPATWWPIELGDVVQSRSPVVPIPVGTANPVVYLGSQDGSIYAVDATRGGKAAFPWGPTPIGPMVQAAPAGIFSAFDGTLTFDYVLAGTRDALGPNAFVALNPFTGVEVGRFNNGGAGPGAIGVINGMAAVDYATRRVYFTSRVNAGGSATTLWCLQLVAPPTVFTGCGWATPRALGDIDSSPVIRGGRIYVGSGAGGGTVYSIDAATGAPALDRTFPHGDGQVKGFVFPDRASNDIYFATENSVWGVTDTGAALMTNKFAGPISLPGGAKPSPVLFVPGSQYLYVGGSDGKLHEIDLLGAPGLKTLPLGKGLPTVGAPSLDRGYDLVHVGTEAGVFYAVETPFPAVGATCVTSCAAQLDGTPCNSFGISPCIDACISGVCSDGGGG